jgi:hypothetical protein
MFKAIVAAACTAAFVSVIGAGGARAELATWDQARVAKYAEELTTATGELRVALESVGIQNITQANARYQVRDTVQMLHNASTGLAEALKNGKGRDETMPRYKRVESLRRDAEEESRRADIPENVFEKVFSVGSALLKLRPYYVDEPAKEAPAQ